MNEVMTEIPNAPQHYLVLIDSHPVSAQSEQAVKVFRPYVTQKP